MMRIPTELLKLANRQEVCQAGLSRLEANFSQSVLYREHQDPPDAVALPHPNLGSFGDRMGGLDQDLLYRAVAVEMQEGGLLGQVEGSVSGLPLKTHDFPQRAGLIAECKAWCADLR